MGLDMYLHAERYLSGYDHTPEPQKALYSTTADAAGLADYVAPGMDSKHAEVSVCVAYWRKANAIHAWFLRKNGPRNADGEIIDDCRPIELDIADLRELYTTVMECIEYYHAGSIDLIQEKLPPASGFFFGSTDIDDWFLQDLESTRDQLSHIIATYKADEKAAAAARDAGERPLWSPSFSYQASW